MESAKTFSYQMMDLEYEDIVLDDRISLLKECLQQAKKIAASAS